MITKAFVALLSTGLILTALSFKVLPEYRAMVTINAITLFVLGFVLALVHLVFRQ